MQKVSSLTFFLADKVSERIEMLEQILIAALGMMLILEGLLPFVFPEFWRKMMQQAMQLPEQQIRFMGLTSIVIGALIIFIFD